MQGHTANLGPQTDEYKFYPWYVYKQLPASDTEVTVKIKTVSIGNDCECRTLYKRLLNSSQCQVQENNSTHRKWKQRQEVIKYEAEQSPGFVTKQKKKSDSKYTE